MANPAKQKMKDTLLYGGLKQEEYEEVRKDIVEHNRWTLRIFSIIGIVVF